MEWKILYSEGSFSSDDGGPEMVPKTDVQAILVRDELIGRRIEARNDFYIWAAHGWRGCDYAGFYDYLMQPGAKIVLFGRTMADPAWRELWTRAFRDPDFAPKSARYPYEHGPMEAFL